MKKIVLVAGTGVAQTELAAFDSALAACGIENYNLVRLSSVLPPGMKVEEAERWHEPNGEWGHKLYVVYAYAPVSVQGTSAWAGIGWVTTRDDGAGLFVEHEADSEEECRELIHESLNGLCINRGLDPHAYEHNVKMVGATCEDDPAAAFAAAIYASEGW